MMKKNLVVGNSSIDNIVASDGTFYQHVCGGNAFQASVSASCFSQEVAILTVVPENFPLKYLAFLQKKGIDITGVKKIKGDLLKEELFIYQKNGDRIDNIFIQFDKDWHLEKLDSKAIDSLIFLAEENLGEDSYKVFRDTYRPSIGLLPSEWEYASIHIAPTKIESVLEALSLSSNVKTLDPGGYIKTMGYDEVLDVVKATDVFIPSKKEMQWIFGDLPLFEAFGKLTKDSSTSIVCKNGKEGCLVYDHSTRVKYSVGTYPAEVKDFTGAGDFFCGALSVCYANGLTLLDAAKAGTIAAAKAIENVSIINRGTTGGQKIVSLVPQIASTEL